MSQTLIGRAAGILFAVIVAQMSRSPEIEQENRRRIVRLAEDHGQDPDQLMKLATDHLAQQIGGGK